MLLEFGAKNFYSFDEGFEASFRLNKNCPIEVSRGLEASTVMCVKGANASGKTNVLRALACLAYFCCESFAARPPDEVPDVVSYFMNDNPSEFYIVFSIGGDEYRYELAVSPEKVYTEELFLNNARVIARNENQFVSLKKQFAALKAVKLRKNASFISTASQYEIEEIGGIYDAFNGVHAYVEGVGRDLIRDYSCVSELYKENEDRFNSVKNIIRRCDLGVQDITIDEIRNNKGMVESVPIFLHQDEKALHELRYDLESSGTKTLYECLIDYQIALDAGWVLVLDEFDINLHPDILPVLVDLFDNPKTNPKSAQLIFTSHNTQIMDKLGKYRTLMVEKEDNSSYVYRLDEIPGDALRNDRKLSPLYEAGKLGGVPNIS